MEKIDRIVTLFDIAGEVVKIAPVGSGWINDTYRVSTAGDAPDYVLQRVNHLVFQDVGLLQRNIERVTSHIRRKLTEAGREDVERRVLRVVPTKDGKLYYFDGENYWRMMVFIAGSVTHESITGPLAYLTGQAFGEFQSMLADIGEGALGETIPNFHNTPDRYRAFLETLERDPMRRAAQVQPEIEFALARQSEMAALQTALKAGELPLRVTHNDTKLNNVLLDAKTRKALCVIDLDTVMPGSSLYDFGDSIRFGAATAAEDERDLSRMEMSIERFRVFTRGYVRSCPGLTQKELELLPLGAKTMTMECGVRFLTDYLDGDHYFAVHRDGQNLDRARTQFRLVADMEKKWNEMQKIVAEEANKER